MKIELKRISVRELVKGYHDDGDDGVRGYGNMLDIRPQYQRAFVYDVKQRDAVIDTITKGFPLNVMYWSVRDDGTFEIIDGQQRTISISQYITKVFAFDGLYFHNLPQDKQNQILDYELWIYLCSGTDSERLNWYETINIAGEVLEKQELRNAVYAGPWVTDAKRYFSRRGGPAYREGVDYLSGNVIRQKYLETAIKWISNGEIEDYMGWHQDENSAEPLWDYFQSVIDWIKATFTTKRSFMKGVDWGSLHNAHRDVVLDADAIEKETAQLVFDDDVSRKAGIYSYILTRDERHLNIRAFTDGVKQQVYEKQAGICANCREHFEMNAMEADHIRPWSDGGKTNEENCQMLCKNCNREKSAR